MAAKLYTSPKLIIFFNGILLTFALLSTVFLGSNIIFGIPRLDILFVLFLSIVLFSLVFNLLTIKLTQFSITDHWIESVSLPILLVSSVGQEIFFRGIMNGLIGILLSTLLFTFWNFFPNKKRVLVSIFFFFLGITQSLIYFYTKNIVYVVYTNFLFHILIRMLKFKK